MDTAHRFFAFLRLKLHEMTPTSKLRCHFLQFHARILVPPILLESERFPAKTRSGLRFGESATALLATSLLDSLLSPVHEKDVILVLPLQTFRGRLLSRKEFAVPKTIEAETGRARRIARR